MRKKASARLISKRVSGQSGDDVVNKFDERLFRPVIDDKKCTKCTLCVVFCPEDAIDMLGKSGFPKVTLSKCTGCLVCLRECPYNAIYEEAEK